MLGKNLAIACALLASLVAGTAEATGWSTNVVTIANVEVDSISGANGTETYVLFSAAPDHRPTCTSATSPWGILLGSADHVKAMTTLATSALLAGKHVSVYWNGSCTGTYPQIIHMQLSST